MLQALVVVALGTVSQWVGVPEGLWAGAQPTGPAAQPEKEGAMGGKAAQPEEKAAKPLAEPVTMGNQLGFVIQKGTEGTSLTTVSEGKTVGIQDGEATVENSKLNKPGLAQNLKIDHVSLGKEVVLVKVVVTPSKRSAEFVDAMEAADSKGQPALVDTKGVKYAAAGFVYRDDKVTKVRFTQGAPLKKMGDAPTVTRSTPERELTLLFVVNEGVELKEFKVGKGVVEDWSGKVKKVEGKGR